MRILWIDIVKWGGVLIYLGHFGEKAGNFYLWAFTFHVPLFSFLSGCVEHYNNRKLLDNTTHKFITIMVPFYFFGVMSIIINCVVANSLDGIIVATKNLIRGGVRNEIAIRRSLWFLSCLYVMELIFYIVKSIFKGNRVMILFACTGIHMYANYVMSPSLNITPKLLYNVDSAAYYIIYFVIGWIIIEPLNRFLTSDRKIERFLLTLISCCCSAIIFFNMDIISHYVENVMIFNLAEMIRAFISIFLVISVSEYYSSYTHLRNIGEFSLYLCGNEYIIKTLMPLMLSTFGLSVSLSNSISTVTYTIILVELVYLGQVKIEKRHLDSIKIYTEYIISFAYGKNAR